MVKTASKSGNARKKNTKNSNTGTHMIMHKHISGSSRVTKYFTSASNISSDASGSFGVSFNSDLARSSPNFGAISADYQSFRVKQISLRMFPSTTSATSVTGPYQGAVALSRWWGKAPTGNQGVLNDQFHETFSTLEEFKFETNWLGFKDAEEWAPVGTAILASNDYGIYLVNIGGFAATCKVFIYEVTYVLEFIGEL